MLNNLGSLKRQPLFYTVVIVVTILSGAIIRLSHFPHIPPGVNQDEAGSAYEAYSLALTGKDKWGNVYPAYFPSWGSGQNVLQAYLSIPFIKVFGLNIITARIVQLILGILTLPLLFFSLKPLGRFTAFLAVFLLALAPWHFMLTHWALESNLLPFFMLLGCYCISRALITGNKNWVIPALLPFALALYAYGTAIMVMPVFFILVLLLFRKRFLQNIGGWLVALGLFLLLAAPFLLSFVKNYILRRDIGWTQHLFFSAPLYPVTRLAQTGGACTSEIIDKNIKFIACGCNDGTSYNLMQQYPVLYPLAVFLGFAGMLVLIYAFIKKRSSQSFKNDNAKIIAGIFLSWFIASLILIMLFPLNINRFNSFFLPCICLGAWFITTVLDNLRSEKMKIALQALILAGVVLNGSMAVRYYTNEYEDGSIKEEFNYGLDEAMQAGKKLPVSQVKITNNLQLPYVYTLFYTQYPPAQFQHEAVYEAKDDRYIVYRFGRYVFYDEYLDHSKPYGYVSRRNEYNAGEGHTKKVFFSNESWEAGVIY